jgi:hypothetical protein
MKEEGANQWKDFWLLLEKIRELDRDEHIIRFNEGYLALSSGLDSNLLETNKKKIRIAYEQNLIKKREQIYLTQIIWISQTEYAHKMILEKQYILNIYITLNLFLCLVTCILL